MKLRQSRSILLGTCLLAVIVGRTVQSFSRPAEVAKPTVDIQIYGHVSHVGWVVKDLDRVVSSWENLGLASMRMKGVEQYPQVIHRGTKTSMSLRRAVGYIGGVLIEWIEPEGGENAYSEFLAKHGDGIHHLAYSVRTREDLEKQIEYFESKGVNVLQDFPHWGMNGRGRAVCLDTARQGGGLTLRLIYDPQPPLWETASPPTSQYPFTKIVQYAILVRDVNKVADFYERLGFGGMPVDHNISVNRNYRGQPGKFEMYLGWWHWGDVTFEWIQSLVGPSVYEEYLKAHGEGFHHLAFEVTDMDRALELLHAKGAPVSQSGGWDSPGGKGRFAYLATEPFGGVTIELLWQQR